MVLNSIGLLHEKDRPGNTFTFTFCPFSIMVERSGTKIKPFVLVKTVMSVVSLVIGLAEKSPDADREIFTYTILVKS
jgi:hypothetical protein